jgi:hypothetical protein
MDIKTYTSTAEISSLLEQLPPLQGCASWKIESSDRAHVTDINGRRGIVYRDEDGDWAYQIPADERRSEEDGWVSSADELAEVLGLAWVAEVVTADGETVEVELGDWIELSPAKRGEYDRGEVKAIDDLNDGLRVWVAWQGAGELTSHRPVELEGVHVYGRRPQRWAHAWPEEVELAEAQEGENDRYDYDVE